ncbi:Nn.00g001850.m01.CDS01 [Neocucurbitaria sp. VM-36]
MAPKIATHDPEKYPVLGQQDEEIIDQGIKKAETGFDSDHDSSSDEFDVEKDTSVDGSTFAPNRVFYILRHNLFSKEVNIIEITSSISVSYTGGEITNDYRDAARAVSEDKTLATTPIYQLKGKHWYSSEMTMSHVPSSTDLATWKHGGASFSKAYLSFPPTSPHSSHSITMAPPKWYKRKNEWVRNSITYSWRCDSKHKANRMTLLKKIGPKQMVVGRYAQKWGSWITGGVLLVDDREEDGVLAALTACVMLRRMQQRAAERAKYTTGGGGGGGGGE